MKKRIALLICGILLCLLPATAFAEGTGTKSAADVPVGIQISLPQGVAQYAYRLTDGAIASRVSLAAEASFSVALEQIGAILVLSWYEAPQSYTITQLDASGKTLAEETRVDGMLKSVIALEPDCVSIKSSVSSVCAISEIAAYSADSSSGEAATVLQPTPEQVDLLIITAEPGMEFREFGALLPTYTKERGMKVAVLYVSDYGKRERAYEALAGLSDAGYNIYPIFCGFTCDNYDSYRMALAGFDKELLTDYLKVQIALLNPKVVVTHSLSDVSGAHSLTAECALTAARESAGVQKCYTFGAADGYLPTVIDMTTPLNAYAGKTAAEVAQSAYDQHVSLRVFGREINTTSAYTLSYTAVGEDRQKNDFFENIDTATLLAYAPATPSPAPESVAVQETATGATPMPIASFEPEAATQPQQGLLAALGLTSRAALASLALGLGVTILMLLFAYRPLKKRYDKGDTICFCMIPLALGLAASAVLAGTTAQPKDAVPNTVAELAASAEPQPAQESNEPTLSAATVEPTADPVAAFEANYYRKAGDPAEVVVSDSEHGHWAYRTDDLGIDIERVSATNSAGKPVTYYVADIHMKDLSEFRPGFGSEAHSGRGAALPWVQARRAKAVLWLTGDNLIHDQQEKKGILIRDGRLFWSANAEDTLAIYPDMSMRIIQRQRTNAETLLEDGVENAYSFGPALVSGGVINSSAKYDSMTRANPRSGIGEIEPGHFIAIVVERRAMRDSVGLTLEEFAALFADYGCQTAYNLNGGRSAAMVFMGEQLNSHAGGGADPDGSVQRTVADGLMFGYSLQVPSESDPIYNDGN